MILNKKRETSSSSPAAGRWITAIICVAGLAIVSLGLAQTDGNASDNGKAAAEPALTPLQLKLERIIVPSIEFTDTPLSVALEFLEHKSEELDVEAADFAEKGINVVLKLGGQSIDPAINLKVSNLSLGQALNFVAQLAGAPMRIDRHAVVFEEPKSGEAGAGALGVSAEDQKITEAKLEQIVLPSIEFAQTPIADALDFLRLKARELDSVGTDPLRKGINIVLIDAAKGGDTEITLRLKNIPLGDALGYVAELANLDLKVEGAVVVLRGRQGSGEASGSGSGFEGGGESGLAPPRNR